MYISPIHGKFILLLFVILVTLEEWKEAVTNEPKILSFYLKLADANNKEEGCLVHICYVTSPKIL